MFSLICTWINGWANNRDAGDLRPHRAHYDVTVMYILYQLVFHWLKWRKITHSVCHHWYSANLKSVLSHQAVVNKANLRDLIAAAGLVILLKLDFSPQLTLKFDGWPWKTIEHLFYTMPSLVHHSKAMGEFHLELQSGNAQFFCFLWLWKSMDDLEKQ